MAFLDKNHRENIEKIGLLWNSLKKLNDLANDFGIDDIFQDNGAKILQQLIYLNFENLPGREGNDAIDENNIEWEMKSINIATSASGFSTNHHLNYDILDKYKKVPWSFAIYRGIDLLEMYVMTPEQLNPFFETCKQKLDLGRSHLNNPKIPIKFVRENGLKVYPIDYKNPLNPSDVFMNLRK